MNEQIWINPRCDRSTWGPGAWDGEPDKVQWTDEATGLVCLAKRNYDSGNWCGYVGVDATHPWHGKDYDDLPDYGPGVHGGLTYADACQEGPPAATICHIPEPGQPDHLWWFGFDCHHCDDLAPGYAARYRDAEYSAIFTDGIYRTLQYVRNECRDLAWQIASAASAPGDAHG